jgi:WD40 repeat protein
MSSSELTQSSAEEESLHANQSSLRNLHQPFPDVVILPMNLIMGLVLPYVQDRSTWNNLCITNKELRDGGRTMTPPWPEITFPPLVPNFGIATTFSPCGHYLACGSVRGVGRPSFVSILDRQHGPQTSLYGGNNQNVQCLSFSSDGKYLAAGGNDGLIRIWPTNGSRKPTPQGLKTLPGHPMETINCLAFASDSNLLASGSDGAIKLWNIDDGVCRRIFEHQHVRTDSLVISGMGASIQCLAATTDGSLIRISWNSSHSEFTSDLVVDGRTQSHNSVFSSSGSFLATIDSANKRCLYEIKTDGMSMTQSVTLPAYCIRRTNAGMAFSPDNKVFAMLGDTTDENDTAVLLIDVKGLTLQRRLQWHRRGSLPIALAFDPSSRYLAIVSLDGTVRLWTV